MDFDPDSPLNRAHTKERQAEDHLKADRFDSAADCFHTSISSLKDVLSLTSNAKSREAIQAQIQRNESQIQLTIKKKDLLIQRLRDQAKKQEQMEQQQQQYQQQQVKAAVTKMNKIDLNDDARDLQMRIVRAMDEHDSLLQVLLSKGEREANATATLANSLSGSSVSYQNGSKVPKGDKTIIEELQVSNEQLRLLVEQLVTELSNLRAENERLNVRITDLMNEQSCNLPPLEQPPILY